MTDNPRRLRTAYGTFIRDIAAWDYWVTLTFTEDVSTAAANRTLRKWLRFIAKQMVNAHVPFASVAERQGRGTWHFHLLLSFPGSFHDFNPRAADKAWKKLHPLAGFTKIEQYDPEQAAAFYIAKDGEPDINIACPRHPCCRRESGCVEAPGSW